MSTEEKSKVTRRKIVRKPAHKKRRKNRVTQFLLVLFALLYLPALWNWMFHGSIETNVLDTGLLELTVPSEGVFIRQESSIKAPREGIILPKVNSVERVPNQYNFAMLIDETSQLTLKKIEELEEDIIRQVAEGFPESLDEDPEFPDQVQNQVNKLSSLAVNKNLTAIKGISSALERLLYQRNKEVFKGQETRLYLQKEKEQLEQLKLNLNNSATMIPADFSGLVVWDDQPCDEKFTAANIDQLALDDLSPKKDDKQVKNEEENQIKTVGADEAFPVSKNQTFARLVDNEKSWYVCLTDSEDAGLMKVGDSLALKVEGLNGLVPCKVESIKPLGNKTKIVLSFNQMIEKTIHLRQVQAELVIESIEGLKIPERSLMNRNTRDNTADIILVRFNRAVIKRIAVIAHQDNFAVIDTLEGSAETDPVSIFDIYVVNPQNIVEGQVIE